SAHAKKVYSIDTDPNVARSLGPSFANVEFRCGDSGTLLPQVLAEIAARDAGALGFALIDGDHSTEGVRRDIESLLRFVPRRPLFVALHDSFNPDCRRGMLQADWQASPHVHYVEIDHVAGEFFPRPVDTAVAGTMWGGLAMAIMLPERRRAGLSIRQS